MIVSQPGGGIGFVELAKADARVRVSFTNSNPEFFALE